MEVNGFFFLFEGRGGEGVSQNAIRWKRRFQHMNIKTDDMPWLDSPQLNFAFLPIPVHL